MSGVLIAAILTAAAVILFYGMLIRMLSEPGDRRVLLIAAVAMLPMQPIAFFFLRVPLDGLLQGSIGTADPYPLLTTLYAPLTEEPAKWLVLLIPLVRRRLTPDNAVPLALATGVGFGLGEIGFLARRLMEVPELAGMPFWNLGGFLLERFVVCFLHGAFLVFFFRRLALGRPSWPGALAGMALHFALNFPIFLAGAGLFGLPPEIWQAILTLYMLSFAALLGAVINGMVGGTLRTAAMGVSTCPECGTEYPRPLLALNLGPVRYERCPACRKFHLVRII